MTLQMPICFTCKHYDQDSVSCPAYPKGIPEDMLLDSDDHDEPRPDQVGDTVYEKGTPGSEKK